MIIQRIIKYLEELQYRALLVTVVLFLVLPAYMQNIYLNNLLLIICMSFLFVQSLFVIFKNRKTAYAAFAIGVLTLVLAWFNFLSEDIKALKVLQLLFFIGFFIFIVIGLIKFLIKTKKVTVNLITVAITVYLIFGIIGGGIFFLIYYLIPDVYSFGPTLNDPDMLQFIYFSFVTMTTLGYGDISPIREEAQVVAYLLAILGQFYIAVIMAILVSKYVQREPPSIAEEA